MRTIPTETWTFVAVDIVLFCGDPIDDEGPDVLVIKRAKAPGAGQWALPGGKVGEGETLIAAAYRELAEETGVHMPPDVIPLQQVHTWADPGIDPRGRVCVVTYMSWLDEPIEPRGGSDAASAMWVPFDRLFVELGRPAFPFHDQAVRMALRKAKGI